MAVTANGTPFVESSDLVANYPGVSLALANHIDANTGKVLQVVRATDATARATSSGTFVDVTGVSVSITPQFATSNIIVMSVGSVRGDSASTVPLSFLQLTDSANTALNGAERNSYGLSGISGTGTRVVFSSFNIVGYVSAVNTSARSYKLRFALNAGDTTTIMGANVTTSIFAIEVSA